MRKPIVKITATLLSMTLAISLAIGILIYKKLDAPILVLPTSSFPEQSLNVAPPEKYNVSITRNDSNMNISPDLRELDELHQKIQSIEKRTGYNYKQMSEKEYEDAIALLKEYNLKMRALLTETQKGASL